MWHTRDKHTVVQVKHLSQFTPHSLDIVRTFLEKYVYAHDTQPEWLLCCLSDMWVLLDESRIVAFMLVDTESSRVTDYCVHYVDYIDTLVRGHRHAETLMSLYSARHKHITGEPLVLVPFDVVPSAAGYWSRNDTVKGCFDRWAPDEETMYEELARIDRIRWDPLLELLEPNTRIPIGPLQVKIHLKGL